MAFANESGKPSGKRLISPSGFVLAMLCFALPFLTVSCEGPTGRISAVYSGFTLAFGGSPHVTTSGIGADATNPPAHFPVAGVQPMALLAVLSVVVGAVAIFVAKPQLHALTSAIAGGAGIVLLITNQFVVSVEAVHRLEQGGIPDGIAGGMVETGNGFWVTVLILLGVSGYNGFELGRGRTTQPPQAPNFDQGDPPFHTGPPATTWPTDHI